MIFTGQRITQKQMLVMRILFDFRGMLYDQLMPELSRRSLREDTKTFRKNTYKDLQALEEMKLIVRDPVKLERTVDFSFLSEAGMECVCESLEIPAGYVGTGWNEDRGDFPYDLHKPPKVTSAAIHHHIMLTDVLLLLEKLKHTQKELQLDYRDNRYSSVEFVDKQGTHRFRPDAEIILGKQRFLIEADRGTEFGEKLREKFQSYSQYLRHLQEKGEKLPAGVIFVMNKTTTNGIARRWSLVSSAFMNEMQEWASRFNLIGCGTGDLESILWAQSSRVEDFHDFYEKMEQYRIETISFGILKQGAGIPWENASFSVVKAKEDSTRIYVYERYEPFETLCHARIHAWWKWYHEAKSKYTDIGLSKYFIPVLWHTNNGPAMLNFKGLEFEKEFIEAFSNRIWLRTNPHPEWFNTTGEPVKIGHPMSRFPI